MMMNKRVFTLQLPASNLRPPTSTLHPPASNLRPLNGLPALFIAALLRAVPLLENRFHPDEALYASFARLIASGRDPLLSGVIVDKPPFSMYLNALSVLLFGGNEFAARLPNLFASIISVALVFALARRLYDSPTAHLAGWIFALSPFAILFSITVFIDPLMTALVLWGLWAASHPATKVAATPSQTRLRGLAFALAFAAKQTALIFLPLALAFSLLNLPPAANLKQALRRLLATARPILIALLLSAIVIFGWDFLRHAPTGFWAQGYSDNVPNRLIRANEVMPRAQAWLDLLSYFTASSVLNLVFIFSLPLLLFNALRSASRPALSDLLIINYLLLYLALYWLVPFAVWDRYLLPILPLCAILFARVFWQIAYGVWQIAHSLLRLAYRVSPKFGIWSLGFGSLSLDLLPLLLCLFLINPALTAARSGYPIGGDHGAYEGIDDAARFIHTLPSSSVLYDHWLSWQWNFYLFDGPLYVAWFPTPDALAADLAAFGRASPRYLAVPAWESDAELRTAAERVGFEFVPVHTSTRRDGTTAVVVYQLRPK